MRFRIILSIITLFLSSQWWICKGCRLNWRGFNSFCYIFIGNKRNFQSANDECRELGGQNQGGQLARITGFELNRFLQNNFPNPREYPWIGLKRCGNQWCYPDDKTAVYTNWIPGQPDNFQRNENCAELTFSSKGRWNDSPCYNRRSFICETDLDECASATKCHAQAKCINSVGSYSCACNNGFMGDGIRRCNDLDECASTAAQRCHSQAKCFNTVGSYYCACKKGFEGDGMKTCKGRVHFGG
ncbi:perlucin-like protein [Dendronephthya gigantea]|uniref:perlucin-like protein n=1 Tax=Dendronephthya gigantea TaxID=151771 RepID=UPI00106BB940|nr:perlucin-like protein [Dendronephthya gigantea]